MAEAVARSGRGRELIFAGAAVGVAIVLVGILVLFAGAKLDAPTLSLAVACAALLYALRGLFAVVNALSRTDLEVALGADTAGRVLSELRDEKKRVLRAIKELDFDFGMGKLSQADYDEIRGKYQARAIEVMRDLDEGGALHPEVQALLEGAPAPSESEPKPESEPTPETDAAPDAEETADGEDPPASAEQSRPDAATSRVCVNCESGNDLDAKFCKECGKPLAAPAKKEEA